MNFDNPKEILKINEQKLAKKNAPYNQLTGEGCVGSRKLLTISDAPNNNSFDFRRLYLPESMFKLKVIQDLQEFGSIEMIYYHYKKEFNRTEYVNFWINLCEIRHKYDFEYYCATLVTIRDKTTSRDVKFNLNMGQRKLLTKLEDQRLKLLPIRLTFVKARQWGGSTLVQMYMNWIQLFHRKNWNSVIAAHKKDASITIRSMMDKTINNMGAVGNTKFSIRNFAGTMNIKQVPERGCLITVGTAVEPDSVRSQDAKMAHLSEVAYYPDTEQQRTKDLVNSIVGSVPRVPLSMIIYESTANGIGDFFYEECRKAKNGETAFEFLFVPWFIIAIYSETLDAGYYNTARGKRKQGGTKEDFVKTLTDYEKNLFANHELCTLENINWYRVKLSEMTSHADMKQEYPSDEIEAFQDSGTPVFRADDVEAMREYCTPPLAVGEVVGDAQPSAGRLDEDEAKKVLENLRFQADSDLLEFADTTDQKVLNLKMDCKLKIWAYPEHINISDRYVVAVDTGGRSKSADWSTIVVIDRYYMMEGGVPEVVADWKGHCDHDILIWIAAQIAKFYDNAELVIESNTHETERGKTDGDHSEFILEVIAEYYDNIYIRENPNENIKEKKPTKYGFHTNTATKTLIIDNYIVMLREVGYYERSHEALNEARYYQKVKGGKFEAMQGKHDDILMGRMIGLFVSYSLPLPREINLDSSFNNRSIVSEATI